MTEAIVNIAETTESNATHFSERKDSETFFQSSSHKISEISVSINDISDDDKIDSYGAKLPIENCASDLNSDQNVNIVRESEENNENENIFNAGSPTRLAKKKYKNFLDSNSEDENCVELLSDKSYFDAKSSVRSNHDNATAKSNSPARERKFRRLIDSDTDEDKTVEKNISRDNDDTDCSDDDREHNDDDAGERNDNNNLMETMITKPLKSRLRMLIDSDSEGYNESKNLASSKINNENATSNESMEKTKSKVNAIVDSESEYDNGSDCSSLVEKNKKPKTKSERNAKIKKMNEKSRFSTLVDTDSEEDIEKSNIEQSYNEEIENGAPAKKSGKAAKKRSGSERAVKDEALRQIHSETQRLIRTSAVSLPYHRPKQRTLQDFLNRKKFIPALPEGLTTAAKVKMSSEIVGRVLEEKEKEAELFYKSSDSENEISVSVNLNNIEEFSILRTTIDEIPIKATRKILDDDGEKADNKKEIQQDDSDIGLPPKLFVYEQQDLIQQTESLETQKNMSNNEKSLNDEKKTIETKNGLRDVNVSRKLFSSDYDEGVDSPLIDSSINVNDDTPNPLKETEIEFESIDEGIHSLSKINEVSSSSDCDGNDILSKLSNSELLENSHDENVSNNITKETKKSLNALDKSFLSNDEHREKSSKENEDSFNDAFISDENTDEPIFGHVYGLPPSEIDDYSLASKKSIAKKKILTNVPKVGPRLRGTPGMIIDFSEDSRPNREGVKSLLDRFIKHSTIKKSMEIDSPITIVHTEKIGEETRIVEEIIPYKLPINDSTIDKELQKPGAKYAKLKMDLIEKMAKKRGEEWRLKEERERDENCDTVDDDDDDADDDGGDDDDNEIKLADDESHGNTESEPEEEDLSFAKSKKRKHREFADEEAEVSGEDDEEDDEDDEDKDENLMEINDEEEDENISLKVNNDDEKLSEESTETKIRPSRIIKAFDDDDNSDFQPDQSSDSGIDGNGKKLERTKTDVDMFEPDNDKNDWSSDGETEFPPSQILHRDQVDSRSQICKTPLTATNVLRFVSPITQLTALNTGNDSPAFNDISQASQRISGSFNDKTPVGIKESPILSDNDKRCGFQKKLFEDPTGTINDEDLMGLCSGKFTNVDNNERTTIHNDERTTIDNEKITEKQLLDLCSGSFPSQINDDDKYENDKNDNNPNENSQDDKLNLDNNFHTSIDDGSSKKFIGDKKNAWTLRIDSSSDESSNEIENQGDAKIVKKRKVQKLDLSDDDDDDDDDEGEKFSSEEILNNEDEEKYVDYDSDENEIVVVPKGDIKKFAADFLEAEAELSESEWGSDDENEEDLDKLEFEEGDNEEIDEDQMRDQLGKIHMRQIQDEDQREVRMLQELLFEDGDLHTDGTGRERKFKWKNIDQLGDDENLGPRTNDGEQNENPVEDENELVWRKERLEREKFIEDKMKLSTTEDSDQLIVNSQLFKLGIKALKRSESSQNSQKEPDLVATKPVPPRTVLDFVKTQSPQQHTRIIHKAVTRNSFLARGDECLARLAVRIKQTAETTIVPRKNSRSCVFTHISPSVAGISEKDEDDATIEDISKNSTVQKRKLTAGPIPRSTKKAKVDTTRSAGKKLF